MITTEGGAPVEVRRSARRTRTVAAFWENGTAVVAIPARFTAAQEKEWVQRMLAKLHRQGERRSASGRKRPTSDAALAAHAGLLSEKVPRRKGHTGVGTLGQQPELKVGFGHAGGRHHPSLGQTAPDAPVGHRLCAAP